MFATVAVCALLSVQTPESAPVPEAAVEDNAPPSLADPESGQAPAMAAEPAGFAPVMAVEDAPTRPAEPVTLKSTLRALLSGSALGVALLTLPTSAAATVLLVASGVGLVVDVAVGGFPPRGQGAWYADTLAVGVTMALATLAGLLAGAALLGGYAVVNAVM